MDLQTLESNVADAQRMSEKIAESGFGTESIDRNQRRCAGGSDGARLPQHQTAPGDARAGDEREIERLDFEAARIVFFERFDDAVPDPGFYRARGDDRANQDGDDQRSDTQTGVGERTNLSSL